MPGAPNVVAMQDDLKSLRMDRLEYRHSRAMIKYKDSEQAIGEGMKSNGLSVLTGRLIFPMRSARGSAARSQIWNDQFRTASGCTHLRMPPI